MFEFDMIQCGLIVLFLMVAGEVISHRLKAVVPSILASAVLFLLLVWSGILPSSVIRDSGLIHLTSVAMMFVILGMGISTNIQDLLANWKVVALAALCYICQTGLVILIISLIFDKNTAIGGLPGGAAVALIVQERARALGHDQIVVLSVLLLAVQGLVACPLVSWMLRKEVTRELDLLTDIGTNKSAHMEINCAPSKESQQKTHSEIESSHHHKKRNQSPNWSLLRFYIGAWIGTRLELYTGISRYVFCLILGILLTKIGFYQKDEMDSSKSHGFLTLMMMTMIFNGFSEATPDMVLSLLAPLCCILLVDVIVIFFVSQLVGHFFGFSKAMRFAIGLNVMVGFPLNLMLAQDIIEFLVESEEDKTILNNRIGTKMVIAGFTSVTFLSTVGAGLLVGFMK